MNTIRDIKRRANRDLHNAAKIPARYISPTNGTDKIVYVRDLTKFGALGMSNGASLADTMPRLIIDRLEVSTLTSSDLFSVELGEMYRVTGSIEPDGEFVTAYVTRMTQGQIDKAYPSGQPLP